MFRHLSSSYNEKKFMDKVAYTKEVLITCAKENSVIVGSDLAKRVGIIGSEDINAVLDSIAASCVEEKVPNLTALVVQASTGIPSLRYFKLYSEVSTDSRKVRRQHWQKIRDSIYEHYSS